MFDLASYLPYLVNRIGVRLAGAFGKELAAYGITLPMWRVMAALRHRGSQRVGRLAAATSIEVSTLSRLLAGMDRRGLVRRQRASTDARRVLVELTQAGARLTQRIIPQALHYEDVALRDFDRADAEALKAMLVRVYDNIGALEEEGLEKARRRA
ncbi:MAG: MarR family winged helix-turn-helix transcriptional regulator [Alphaproteobacteria bacterium]